MLGRNNNKKRPPPPSQPSIDIAGSKMRSKNRAVGTKKKWDDLPNPILIGIFNWLDQESLMNLTLVSKQLHKIIAANGPGIENKIIPVFEVSGSSTQRFFQILRNNFFNEEIKNKLQYYPHMKLNNIHEFDRIPVHEMQQMTRDVRMDWITSLDISSPSPCPRIATMFPLSYFLSNNLPKLREIDFSKAGIILPIYIAKSSPLLEKITANKLVDCPFSLIGNDMRFCNNLKEIYMDHSIFFYVGKKEESKISDLNNHHDIFMFRHCCKALERVSIRNIQYRNVLGDDDEDEDQKLIFTQNLLIKFVRNAPLSLHWFRSDLTPDNITMLRMERPGIELLN
jgi:hypothetical protein